jgi:hypothetical protein
MKANKQQIDKIRSGFLKALKEKKDFIKHFANGGSVEDFKPKEKRTVVRPI